jgi:hypothetical protein
VTATLPGAQMPSGSTPAPPTPTRAVPAAARRKWGIYTPGELRQRCKELDSGTSVIAGLIPQRSLSLLVGDSHLGKSPLMYQAAICVAAGIPFLGHPVSKGRVLYLDFENGLGDVDDMITRLSRYLRLPDKPENLLLWNYNDAPPEWTNKNLGEMLCDARPVWAIIDSLSACYPGIEEKSGYVTRTYQEFRKISRDCGTAIAAVHHPRKPSTKPEEKPPSLEEDPHEWFQQTRGSRQLINGSDVRIGVDRLGRTGYLVESDGKSREVALVLAGFGRVRAHIPTTFIARVRDEDGEPVGYDKLTGASLLFNATQEEAYRKLPPGFRFREAQMIYDRGAQATTDFLKKCIGVGIMRKDGTEYRKVEVAEQAE